MPRAPPVTIATLPASIAVIPSPGGGTRDAAGPVS